MVLFFKQLRCFLIYSCLFAGILFTSHINPYDGNHTLNWLTILFLYTIIINNVVVGFIGYKTQKKYKMSICRIFQLCIVVFIVTLGSLLILTIPYSWDETWFYELLKWAGIALIAPFIFGMAAINAKKQSENR